jgi:hypothetical protein
MNKDKITCDVGSNAQQRNLFVPLKQLVSGIACKIGNHEWAVGMPTNKNDVRVCLKCRKKQYLHRCGASDQFVWKTF